MESNIFKFFENPLRLMSPAVYGGAVTFVAQLSSIVGVTETLPGLHTAAIDAARMRDTLVTVLPLPAIQTPEGGTPTAEHLNINVHRHGHEVNNSQQVKLLKHLCKECQTAVIFLFFLQKT